MNDCGVSETGIREILRRKLSENGNVAPDSNRALSLVICRCATLDRAVQVEINTQAWM